MIYLVTKSERYYPNGGARDFRSSHADEDAAREAFAAACAEGSDSDCIIYLLEVGPDGWAELDSRDLRRPAAALFRRRPHV